MTAATTPSPAISWDGVAVDLGGHPIVHDVSIAAQCRLDVAVGHVGFG